MTETTIDELAERRSEMELTLSDIGDRLADREGFDLASSTLSTRIGQWERGDRDADAHVRAEYADVLETIQAELDYEHPECDECGCTPEFEPDVINGESYCIVCSETIQRDRRQEVLANVE